MLDSTSPRISARRPASRLGIVLASCVNAACAQTLEPAEGSTGGDSSGSEEASTTSSGDVDTTSGPDPIDLCALGGEPMLEIGHGNAIFEPFDAYPAELIAGPQGGYHILIGVRGRHLDGSDTAVARLSGSIDGISLGFSAPYADLVCTPSGLEATNLLLVWDSTPGFLEGRTARVQVELTDTAGTIVLAEGEVVIEAN